jgi:hypothetical protein
VWLSGVNKHLMHVNSAQTITGVAVFTVRSIEDDAGHFPAEEQSVHLDQAVLAHQNQDQQENPHHAADSAALRKVEVLRDSPLICAAATMGIAL